MPFKIAREELLRAARSVVPGLSPREIVEQQDSLVFKNGDVHTYNEQVFCRCPSGLPAGFPVIVVKAKKFIGQLTRLPDTEVEIEVEDKTLVVRGKRRRLRFRGETEILLPIDTLVMPKDKEWKKLNPDFTEAVGVVGESASTDASAQRFTCVHVHPNYMEACDGDQATRYTFKTGVTKPILVKRDALRFVPNTDPMHLAEVGGWLVFRNADGLIIGCQRYGEEFENLDRLFEYRGAKTVLPKLLTTEIEIAADFAKEDSDNPRVRIDLKPGWLKVTGAGDSGDYEAVKKIRYDGPEMKFQALPRLLLAVLKLATECEIDSKTYHLIVRGENYSYVASFDRTTGDKKVKPSKNGKPKKAETAAVTEGDDDGN